MNILKVYDRLLNKYPWPTKCLTSGFLFGLGDAITQLFIQKVENYDYIRTSRMGFVGLCFAGPVLNLWYTRYLPNLVHNQLPAFFPKMKSFSKNQNLFMMVGIDQTLFAVCFTSCFFVLMDFLETRKIKNGIQNVKEKLWPTMLANWKLWPAAQAINFGIIPLQYRLLWANFVGLIWNAYLSYAQFRKK